MPFTPYHFGPAGFIGLVFKKWIDIPVFVLANVAVDVEVLIIYIFSLGWPVHRYCHTFLGGLLVGFVFAFISWPLRGLFKKIMNLFRLPYSTTFRKMLVWSIAGVWLHVFIDSICHYDMKPCWPSKVKPLYNLITEKQVMSISRFFWAAAIVLLAVNFFRKSDANKSDIQK
jgi:membrane-bound metal-dependent hydrolase YbcI (DUF457 family)